MNKKSQEIQIRPYTATDRVMVRQISYETSFLGKADELFDEPEMVADALTVYFTDSEPKSCFVAVVGENVVGYLLGARNEKSMSKISWLRVYPRLVLSALFSGVFFKKKTSRFVQAVWESFLKGEFRTPNFSKEYPAICHINVAEKYRGIGVGQKLAMFYLEFLKTHHVSGVRVSVMSEPARIFFEKCGFKVLYAKPRTYLRYWLGHDIPVYLLAKSLK